MRKTGNKRYVILLAALVGALLFASEGWAAGGFGIDQSQPAEPSPRPNNDAPVPAPKASPITRAFGATAQPAPPAGSAPAGSGDPKKSTVNLERPSSSSLGEPVAGQQFVFTGVSPPPPVLPREHNISGASSVPAWMLRAAGLLVPRSQEKSGGTMPAL